MLVSCITIWHHHPEDNLGTKLKFRMAAMLLFSILQKLRSYIFRRSMIVVLIVGNQKVTDWGGFQWHNVQAKFRENQFLGSKIERLKQSRRQHGELKGLFYFPLNKTN